MDHACHQPGLPEQHFSNTSTNVSKHRWTGIQVRTVRLEGKAPDSSTGPQKLSEFAQAYRMTAVMNLENQSEELNVERKCSAMQGSVNERPGQEGAQ